MKDVTAPFTKKNTATPIAAAISRSGRSNDTVFGLEQTNKPLVSVVVAQRCFKGGLLTLCFFLTDIVKGIAPERDSEIVTLRSDRIVARDKIVAHRHGIIPSQQRGWTRF